MRCAARGQFDRSGRTKSESLSGLEEVLTCLQPSTFFDDQLSRYRGLCWTDFLASVHQQRPSVKATKSTLTSTTEEAANPGGGEPLESRPLPEAPVPVPRAPAGRNVLVRQSTQQDYSSRLKVSLIRAHSTFISFATLINVRRSGARTSGRASGSCAP